MAVKRIVRNIAAEEPERARSFYVDVLGLEPVMDLGWIATYAGSLQSGPQISVAREGGNGTPVPDISIEVDNLEDVLAKARELGFAVEYGPSDEDWGVRRFYVRDPFGNLVNILQHL